MDEGDWIIYFLSGWNWYVFFGYIRMGCIFYEWIVSFRDCGNFEIFVIVLIEYDFVDKKIIEDDLGWIIKSLCGCS